MGDAAQPLARTDGEPLAFVSALFLLYCVLVGLHFANYGSLYSVAQIARLYGYAALGLFMPLLLHAARARILVVDNISRLMCARAVRPPAASTRMAM